MKKLFGVLVVVLCAAGIYWRVQSVQQAKAAGAASGKRVSDVAVLTAVAERRTMPVELRTFGTVQARSAVTVKAQVGGLLSEVLFTEGQDISKCDLLARIDARPFEVALHRAEAALASAQAQRVNAERTLRRLSELFAKGFASETDRDQAATTVSVQQAAERAEEAAIESARIQLGYCTIRAPISGRAGRRLADPGNLVVENVTSLVTINEIRPVHVGFGVPQQDMARLRDSAQATNLEVVVSLPESESVTEIGRLVFFDNAVDRATGTVLLKGEFENADGRLWPGQFVNVQLCVAVETNVVVVPFKAVQNGQKGTYVYTVQADSTVAARYVDVARNADDVSVIAKGLQGGETVVTDGQQRLGAGAKVLVSGKAPGPVAERAAP